MFSKLKLTYKMIIILLIFGLLPAGVISIVVHQSVNDITEDVGHEYRSHAEAMIDKIDRNLFERYGDVQAFGLNRAVFNKMSWYVQNAQNSSIVSSMNSLIKTYGVYYLSILVDLQGEVIAVNTVDAQGRPINSSRIYGRSFANASWFKDVVAHHFLENKDGSLTGTVVEDLHIDRDVADVYENDGLALGFSAPVFDESGKMIAVWSNRAKFDFIEQIIVDTYQKMKSYELGAAELTLLNRDGEVIVDYDPTISGTESVKHDLENVILKLNLARNGVESAQRAIAGESGNMISFHARKNISQVAGYAHSEGALGFPGLSWSVLVRVPENIALASPIKTQHTITTLLIASTLLILGLAWPIGRYFASPIIKLKDASEKVTQGELDVTVHLKQQDEIGELSNSFNAMVNKIRDSIKEAENQSQSAKQAASIAESARQKSEKQEIELREGVDHILHAMEDFQQGDLTVSLSESNTGEIGELYLGFNRAVSNIKRMVEKIALAVQSTAASGEQISSATDNLAHAAQEQTQQSLEVAGAVEEMASTISETTKNTTSTAELAKKSGEQAQKGGDVIREAIGGMNSIVKVVDETAKSIDSLGKSSHQIGEIIQVIDEIADQTNLLALNAAIEAARAGEQGRGFAVVADEVRKLAERTSTATKEIAQKIKQIQTETGSAVKSMNNATERTEEGKKLVDAAGETLNKIIENSDNVLENITLVAAASEEQAQTSEEISSSIEKISSVTQESGAGTQEINRAVEELNQHMRGIQDLLNQFKIANSDSKSGFSRKSPVKFQHNETVDVVF